MAAPARGAKRISKRDHERLEELYRAYNDRRWRASDPVEHVHRYEGAPDREIAALVASSLAFGGVLQIRSSVERALAALGPSPADFLESASPARIERVLGGFRHRWITGEDLAGMLRGARSAIAAYGSLGELFRSRIEDGDPDTGPAACRFVGEIRRRGGSYRSCLLPTPESGSACKRLHLMLRWMIRSDEIDTGLWQGVPPSLLLVPLDVHVRRAALAHGLTGRRAADHAAAREVTAAFRTISPEDPVKYDFALAHAGMRGAGWE